jgi:hypothetical protein
LPFIEDAAVCASFSQATLNGKKVILSGEDPYKNIVLPLVKSNQYKVALDKAFVNSSSPSPTLVFCICVLDAPMLLVEAPNKAGDPILTPWIRVMRLEAKRSDKYDSHQFFGIDFVHIDGLDLYLKENLMPFAAEFAQRSRRLERIWTDGGIVQSMSEVKWDLIQPKTPRR